MDRDEAIRLLEGGPDGVREWNHRRMQAREIPNLRHADLTGADLNGAGLRHADLSHAYLRGADLSQAICGETNFGNVDLSGVDGLESIRHEAPSTVGVDTLVRSRGKIPETFLRRCGVPDALIRSLRDIISAMQPIQFYSCFISYSTENEEFAKRLHS